jgi:hypothetical protein
MRQATAIKLCSLQLRRMSTAYSTLPFAFAMERRIDKRTPPLSYRRRYIHVVYTLLLSISLAYSKPTEFQNIINRVLNRLQCNFRIQIQNMYIYIHTNFNLKQFCFHRHFAFNICN